MSAPALTVFRQGQGAVGADPLNGFVQSCNTFADLRAFPAVSGMQVYVRGGVTIGDGSQGTFYWNPTSIAADNGTSVIRPTGVFVGAWIRDDPIQTNGIIPVEQFGAVGNGIVDDSAAINAAMAAAAVVGSGISFRPGRTYYIASSLIVPVGCRVIYGLGAIVQGPGTPNTNGAGTQVDGFTYTGWYIGGGTINPLSSMHYLPDVIQCRYGISLVNSSWVNIQIQYIEYCASGIYCHAPGVGLAGYCVQSVITAQTVLKCNACIDVGANILSGIALQGNIFNVAYSAGNNIAVLQTWGTTNPLFDQNTFNINIIDANGCLGTPPFYAVYADVGSGGTNWYSFSSGLVTNANFNPQPFKNTGQAGTENNRFDVGPFHGNSPSLYPLTNFFGAGPVTTVAPGFGDLILYISPTGSDTTGLGTSAAPYATMQYALSTVQDAYVLGGATVTLQLADGTYTGGLNYNCQYGNGFRAALLIRGDPTAPANVIINVAANYGVIAQGPGAVVTIDGLTLEGANGIAAAGGGIINVGGSVVFGAVTGYHMNALQNGLINIGSNYTITGGGNNHLIADEKGEISYLGSITVTLTGTPAFTVFAQALHNSIILAKNITFSPASGAATGEYYSATLGGGIDTGGGGATYFPGNSGGTTTPNGWYN